MENEFKAEVLRATQSPLNKKQWNCELSCGHELWRTSSRRPKGSIVCTLCAAAPIMAKLMAELKEEHGEGQ